MLSFLFAFSFFLPSFPFFLSHLLSLFLSFLLLFFLVGQPNFQPGTSSINDEKWFFFNLKCLAELDILICDKTVPARMAVLFFADNFSLSCFCWQPKVQPGCSLQSAAGAVKEHGLWHSFGDSLVLGILQAIILQSWLLNYASGKEFSILFSTGETQDNDRNSRNTRVDEKKIDDDIVILGSTCVFEVYSSESMYKKIAPLSSFFKVKNKNSLH